MLTGLISWSNELRHCTHGAWRESIGIPSHDNHPNTDDVEEEDGDADGTGETLLMMMMEMVVVALVVTVTILLTMLVLLTTLTRQIWQNLIRILIMHVKIPLIVMIPMDNDGTVTDDAALMMVMDEDQDDDDDDDDGAS